MHVRKRLGAFGVIWVIALIAGCSNNDGLVGVSGKVTLDGKAVEGATVAFIGGNGGTLATATSDASGSFKVRVASGSNKVTVSKVDISAMKAKSDEEMTMGTDAQVAKQKQPKSLVPEKYGNPATSGLNFDVKAGMGAVDLVLVSK